jgi:hypothetical protein
MNLKAWSTEKLFARLLHAKSEKGRWDKIGVLHQRPCEQVFAQCIECLHSACAWERRVGVDVLAQLGLDRPYRKPTLRLYFDLLAREKNAKVLASVLFAIGHNNERLTRARIRRIAAYQHYADWRVRHALAFALFGVDDAIAIKALIALSADTAAQVRDWATCGLGDTIKTDNEPIRAALWKRVEDKDSDTRNEAIHGLAVRGDVRVKPWIWKELRSGDERAQVFDTLMALGDAEFLPFLEARLRETQQYEAINTYWLSCLKKCVEFLKTPHPE